MKLNNLKDMLTICIEYHQKKGNKQKVKELKTKLKEIDNKKL